MNPFRRTASTYRAVLTDGGWELRVDDAAVSIHKTFSEAVEAATTHDRIRLRRRVAMNRIAVVAVAALLLVPVVSGREVANPDHPPARAFADQMEAAYRAVDDGTPIESVTGEGISGAVLTVDRGGVSSDYNVLAGTHQGDCYVIRWVRFEVPFVAKLLPRFECAPGAATVNFSPSAFEVIAVNLSSTGPLNWDPVVPPEVDLAPWFFPLTILLAALIFHQLVGLSLAYLRPPAASAVEVERIDRS